MSQGGSSCPRPLTKRLLKAPERPEPPAPANQERESRESSCSGCKNLLDKGFCIEGGTQSETLTGASEVSLAGTGVDEGDVTEVP